MPRRSFITAACLFAISGVALAAPDAAALDFFEKKIRPLLAERCLECHSPDKKVKGGLRLDTRDGWLKGGDTGPAIVPGEPDQSLLITAVRYKDRDLQMPEKRKLPDAEIAVLEEWVKMGAPDPRTGGAVAKKQTGLSLDDGRKFWSYAPVTQPAIPAVKSNAWPRGDIDRFILARIEAADAQPAADSAPAALCRRIYYTLTGLPPTPDQLDAFADSALRNPHSAVASLVDTLLATPQFGEKWGRHWLDVARFAESSGGGRTLLFKDAWRYRDYVIESLNADVPFDRFIREQLAGDLLPAATPADRRRQLAATAFLALGPTNYEEQDKQQLRFDVIDEQLETLGRAFLGQTIGCARCHDHKFDPVPQRDYYALAGILASTRTLENYTDNVAKWISSPLPLDGEQEGALLAHEGKLAALRKDLDAAKAALAQASKATTEATGQPGTSVAADSLPGIVIDNSQAKVVGDWISSTHVRSFIGQDYLHDGNAGKGGKSITFTPAIPKSGRYEVRLAYTHAAARAKNVRVHVLHADGEDDVFVDQSLPPPIDGRFVSLGKFRFEKDGAGYVLVSNDGTSGYVTVDALQLVPEGDEAVAELAKDASPDASGKRSAQQRVKTLEADLKALAKDGPDRPTAMAVRDDDRIADTKIRIRGQVKQTGDLVPRGFLRVAMTEETPAPSPKESGRRELAEWIADARNPLTARVTVNRVWHWLFGAGLVRTVDNFGTTGEKPSHPELLDHLALRFTAEGWSVKKLIHEIMLSRTWQLAVAAPGGSDPENRLFAHANRRRLDAEQIRDGILAASGALKLDVGGPNIAQAGDVDPNNFSAQNIEYSYVFADTRRSVYVPAFRNKRLELFEAFDFGDINASMGQRNVSTVAPQALFFLNHPFVAGQAKLAAQRALAEPGDDAARLTALFRRTLGRPPSAAEAAKCLAFLASAQPDGQLDAWTQVQQTVFASLDFRYLE